MPRKFEDILQSKISRRAFLLGGSALIATTLLPAIKPFASPAKANDLQCSLPYKVLIKWGDKIGENINFGYNNDYIAYIPLDGSKRGLLCVNHEYTNHELMFPDSKPNHVEEMQAHGHSVVEVFAQDGNWHFAPESAYNRRFNAYDTEFAFSGAVADKLSPVIGTINNCSGGKTPYGSVLVCEENIDHYFKLDDSEYGISHSPRYQWHEHDQRFASPAEAEKFGWVWEFDPKNPQSVPTKKTSLGRFKHESATCVAQDDKIVVYMGDDERFEHLYKYIGTDLDNGTLYVAVFDEKTVRWLPIPTNELIHTRNAAKKLGATEMDRPEDIAVLPTTNEVFVACSNNHLRTSTNPANPRSINIHGHIIKLQPQKHTDLQHGWDIFLLGDKNLSCPDNLTFDPQGRLWIATDGMAKTTGKNDALFMIADTANPQAKQILSVPIGAEPTGIEFTPDGKTMFVAIQHPAEGSTFAAPSTRWPEFDPNQPPKPAVIVVTIS